MSSLSTRWGALEFFVGPLGGITTTIWVVTLIADRESGVYRVTPATLLATGAIALALILGFYLVMRVVVTRMDRNYQAAKDELTHLAANDRPSAAARPE